MSDQTQTPENVVMNDDQVLAFTQGIRVKAIGTLTQRGAVPEENSDRNFLINMLDGLDRQALGNKRLKVDEQTNNGMVNAANLVAHLLNTVTGVKRLDNEVIEGHVTPVLGNEVPTPQLVPGETEVNPGQLDYNSFITNVRREREG